MVEQEQPGAGSAQGHPDLAAVQPQADNDKLLGALSYIFWFLVPIIILVTDMKNSRFAKAHAYQGIVFAVAGTAFYIVYSIVYFVMTAIFWPLACVLWIGWLIPFVLAIYIAYKVFSAGQLVFPYLTDLTRQLFKDL